MIITIGMMMVVLNMKGFESDLSGVIIMGMLSIFSLILLVWFLKRLNFETI
jgi:hypothetical protein